MPGVPLDVSALLPVAQRVIEMFMKSGYTGVDDFKKAFKVKEMLSDGASLENRWNIFLDTAKTAGVKLALSYTTRQSYKGKSKTELGNIMGNDCPLFDNGAFGLPNIQKELVVGGVTPDYQEAKKRGAFTEVKGLQWAFQTVQAAKLHERLMNPLNTQLRMLGTKLGGTGPDLGIRDFSVDDARNILEKWNRAFALLKADTVATLALAADGPNAAEFQVNSFAVDSFDVILDKYTEATTPYIIAGYVILIVYASLSLISWTKDCGSCLRFSRSAVGASGVITVALSVISALCLGALFGIPMNATSLQVLPFLLLGLVWMICLSSRTRSRHLSPIWVPRRLLERPSPSSGPPFCSRPRRISLRS